VRRRPVINRNRAACAERSPVAFTRAQSQPAAENDSATVAAISATAALSPRGLTVAIFAVVGAVLLTLTVNDDSGCMTVLPYVYAVVIGAGVGALVGWIVTAL
jgi:hypothetical protein